MAKQDEMDALLKKLKKSVDKPVDDDASEENPDNDINNLLSNVLKQYNNSESKPDDKEIETNLPEPIADEPTTVEEPEPEPISAVITDRKDYVQDSDQGLSVEEISVNGGEMSAFDKKNGIHTDEDIRMLIELGYESELIKLYGEERVDSVRRAYMRERDSEFAESVINGNRKTRGVRPAAHYGKCSAGIRRDTDTVIAKYNKIKSAYKFDLIIAALVSVLLAVYDNPSVFLPKAAMSGVIKFCETPFYPIFGIVLLAFGVFAARRPMKNAIKGFIGFNPTPDSASMITLAFTVIYGVFIAFFGTYPMQLLNFPASILMLTSVICYNLEIRRRIRIMQLANGQTRKYVLTKGRFRDAQTGEMLSAETADCLSGVPEKLSRNGFSNGTLTLIQPIIIFVSALIGGIYVSCGYPIVKGVGVFMTVLTFCTPINTVLYSAIPSWLTSYIISKIGAGVIDGTADIKSDGYRNVCFTDSAVFESSELVTLKKAVVSESFDMKVHELFDIISGRISQENSSVSIAEVCDGGVEAHLTDGSIILLGTYSYLLSNGVNIPIEDGKAGLPWETNTMYASLNGNFESGYVFDYKISGQFTSVAEALGKHGVSVSVSSYIPCVNTELLKTCGLNFRVVRPESFGHKTSDSVSDSDVFASESELSLSLPIASLDVTKKIKRDMIFVTLGYILAVAAFASVILYFDYARIFIPGNYPAILSFAKVNSILTLSLQTFGCLPVGLSVIRIFRLISDFENLDNTPKGKKQ